MTGNGAGFAHNCLFCILRENARQFQICPRTLLGCAGGFRLCYESMGSVFFFNNPDHLPRFISLEQHTGLILQ